MTRNAFATSFALVLGLTFGLAGGASADDAALERLRQLTGFDEKRVKTTHMGFYMGTQLIGGLVTSTAKSDREDAVYLEHTVITFQFGPQRNKEEISVYLAADLSLVSETKVKTDYVTDEPEEEGDEPPVREVLTTTTISREGEEWVRKTESPDGELIQRAPAKGPNYNSSLTPVLTVFAGTPGTYTLPGVMWQNDEPKEAELKLTISEASEYEHRGQKISAAKAVATGKGEAITLMISPKGDLLLLAPEGAPVRFVGGTKEECAKDLPGGKELSEAEGTATPMEAVTVYFHVLAGALPIESLDKVLDYKAVQAFMAEGDPNVAAMTPAMIADLLRTQFKKVIPALPKDQADLVLGMMSATIEGDTATAAIPGKEDSPFKLRKNAAGKWVITVFPH